MTRRPFRPTEVDGVGDDLEPTITDLERYLADSAADPSSGFADRVMHEIASEPIPRRGVLASITTAFSGERGRVALLAATIAAAILVVVAAGQLGKLIPSQVGDGSPSPTISTPSIGPSVTPSLLPSPSTEPSAEPSSTPSVESESPRASGDDDDTPSPSGSPDESDDTSGPGGGGGDADDGNSGPGSGSQSPESESD